jgi:predicted alpha/beta-hydrolase family hydrolase
MSVETFPWIDNADDAAAGGRRAILLPGGAYTVDHPLLFYVAGVLAAQGWFVQCIRWEVDADARVDPVRFAADAAELAADAAPPGPTTLVVGKSFGTRAAPWVTGLGLPAIWLTPLLHEPAVADAIRAATAPTLLVGGTADDLWDSEVALASGQQVHEIALADHGLQIGRDWRQTLVALADVLTVVETFAAGID